MERKQALDRARKPIFKVTKVNPNMTQQPNSEHEEAKKEEVIPAQKRAAPVRNSSGPPHLDPLLLDKSSALHIELSLMVYHWLSKGEWTVIASSMGQGNPEMAKAIFYQLMDNAAGVVSVGITGATYITSLLFVRILYACMVFTESISGSVPVDRYISSIIKRARLTVAKCDEALEKIKMQFLYLVREKSELSDMGKYCGVSQLKEIYAKFAEAYQESRPAERALPVESLVITLLERALIKADEMNDMQEHGETYKFQDANNPKVSEEIKENLVAMPQLQQPPQAKREDETAAIPIASARTQLNPNHHSIYFIPNVGNPNSGSSTSGNHADSSPGRVSDFTMVTSALKRIPPH